MARVCAAAILVVLSGAAWSAENRDLSDGILSRAALERGAFLACAGRDGDKQMIEMLTRSWRMDLRDSAKILTQAGYNGDYVRTLDERFSLDKTMPKFADPAAAARYCAMLGDWRNRLYRLIYIVPQLELSRSLKQ